MNTPIFSIRLPDNDRELLRQIAETQSKTMTTVIVDFVRRTARERGLLSKAEEMTEEQLQKQAA